MRLAKAGAVTRSLATTGFRAERQQGLHGPIDRCGRNPSRQRFCCPISRGNEEGATLRQRLPVQVLMLSWACPSLQCSARCCRSARRPSSHCSRPPYFWRIENQFAPLRLRVPSAFGAYHGCRSATVFRLVFPCTVNLPLAVFPFTARCSATRPWEAVHREETGGSGPISMARVACCRPVRSWYRSSRSSSSPR